MSRMTDTSPTHAFDIATHLEPKPDGNLIGHTSDAFWNFTGPFGGTTAATLLRAVMEHERRIGDPLAITVNFCAPTARGAFDVALREVRTNRSTQHWTAELSQPDAGIAATATIACAIRRSTWSHRPLQPPPAAAPETLPALPTEGMMAWMGHYDFRFALNMPRRMGRVPSAEPASALSHVWVADKPARALDFLSLTAIADTFFGRIFHVRGALLPIGTVSMTTYFHADAGDLAAVGSAHVLGVADAKVFNKSYSDQTVDLFSRAGALLATSHQIVYFRDVAA
jgi:hypothetical protein